MDIYLKLNNDKKEQLIVEFEKTKYLAVDNFVKLTNLHVATFIHV